MLLISHKPRPSGTEILELDSTRSFSMSRSAALVVCLWLTAALSALAQQNLAELHASFRDPPADSRIMMRWWWFGPAVTKAELQHELEQMKDAGIGGVEVATLYPQALDDPATGFHNLPFLSDAYISDLRFAGEQARKLGMRMDVTLGSGWPFGGPHIPITQAAGELRVEPVPIPAMSPSVAVPSISTGENLLQIFVVPGGVSSMNLADAKPSDRIKDGRLSVTPDDKSRTALFFISSRTGMMVKRPSVGASGFVLDHYDARAMATHLQVVGDRLLQAFPGTPPYAVFSDSLEDYGSDWTPQFLTEFRNRRGYDLTPYLPALIGDDGPETAAIRHDWGRTLTELADENFLEPMHAWAHKHGTLLRSQTYGVPPVTLSSNRFEDLPEGEGKATINMWREFSDTRWAASAGHLFGHNIISSETWTWLHSPAFRATPLDMKAEADLHFLQGINQLVGHGWPYSPQAAGDPGWRMYAAAALNAHNPWYFVMPDLTKYLQRVSFALRLGKPDNDVALLLPNDDAWASFTATLRKKGSPASAAGFDETGNHVSIDESMSRFLGGKIIGEVLDAGYNLDFIDADAIDTVGIPYKVLLLPGIDRIPAKTYEKIADFARHGGIVIATRRLPSTAPGFLDHETESARIRRISHSLFDGSVATAHFIQDEASLGTSLHAYLEPDFTTEPAAPEIGFIHRKLKNGDLYFIANTSNRHQRTKAHFRASRQHAEMWDACTGQITGIPAPARIPLDLEPYESRLIFFSDDAIQNVSKPEPVAVKTVDLSSGWHVTFNDPDHRSLDMTTLRAWQDIPGLRFYSGTATYEKDISLEPGTTVTLDFGEGTSVAKPDPLGPHNMRAYLESPVREAAQVFLNGNFAGYVWHPPYRIDLTPFVRPGLNRLKIVVGNTAINALAGQSQPDYRLLYARYGVLFIPQDMDHLQPLPSGIIGPVKLLEGVPAR